MSILICVFREGTPLLMLFEKLDGSLQRRWGLLRSSQSSDITRKLAVLEFVQACVDRLGLKSCFTVADLMGDDMTKHVKASNTYITKL